MYQVNLKMKKKKAKKIKKVLGFTDQDIIDAADAVLEKEISLYYNGVYDGKAKEKQAKLDAKGRAKGKSEAGKKGGSRTDGVTGKSSKKKV